MKLMHETNTENSELKLLFSTTNLSPMVKLAIISIDSNSIPKFVAFAAFIFSQFQMLSLFLKSGLMCFSNKSLTLFKSFSSIHDAISIGDSLDFHHSFTLAILIIAIAYIYLIFGMLLLMYLLRNMYREKIHSKVLQKIWSIGACLHILVFFYPINTISLKVTTVSFAKDDRQVFHTEHAWTFMQVSSCLAFIINSLLSTIILIYLLPPVKAGFALASKTKKLSIMDIALRFLLPFLWMLDFESQSFNIFITVFNLIFCLLKDFIFFRTLPFYNMMALRIAVRIYASLTLFALAVVISVSLSYADLDENLFLIGILWLLIGPSAVKLYSTCLESIFDKILFSASSNTNSYYLAQYWYIFKDKARKRGCLDLEARKFNKGHFRLMTFLEKIMHTSIYMTEREEYLQIKDLIYSKKEGIFESANYVLNLGIGFLKNYARKHPLEVLPKLALASHYIKYHHSYQMANYVIYQGLNKSSSFTKKLSFGLLLLKIIRKLRLDKAGSSKSEDKVISKGSLSIERYLSMHQQFEKIKEDIKHQLEPQIKFWKNFQLANTDLDSFISLAQLTHQRSTRVFRYIKNHQVFVGSNFIEPLFTLGLYLSFMQNDSASGGKMMKEYDLWSTKPKNNTKNASSMMNNGSVYFVVSASFHDIGKILNYSKSANQMLSLHKESAMGKSINSFAPSIYGKDNKHILGVSLKEDISASFEKSRELPILDREGKLHECWVNITLEFLPKVGLSYCILLRPTDVPYRIVLIKQNGLIIHSSGRFEKDMGIKTTEKKSASNIFSFCQQLSILVRAFQHRPQQGYLPLEKRSSNGSEIVYSVCAIEEKDELKDTLANKDREYYRLCEKYRTGETLIFYPHSKQKGDSSPISIVSDSKAGVFARPIVYKTIIEVHNIGNENIFQIKLKEEIGANLDLVWANLDPALKIHDTQKYTTYRETEHTLKSLKSKGMSPLLTKNSRLSSHLARTSILGVETSTEDKLERLKSNLTNKSNNTPPNSCDLRESDREIIINEPIQRTRAEAKVKKLEVKKSEEEEEVIDEDLKMKIIKLGLVKKENKVAEKWLETVEHAQRHRGSFKVGSDMADFKDSNIRKMVNQMHNNNQNQLIIEESTSVSSRSRAVRSEKTLQKILKSRNASKTTICYLFYVLFTALGMLAVVLWFSFNGSDMSQRVKTVSEALQNIYMRCFWTNLANQETRIWSGVRGGIVDPNWSEGFIDIAIETRTTNTTFHKMDQFNNQLYQAIASMDDETQLLFATKNVRLYDRDENNNLVLIGVENTFQTTSRILTEGFINVYMPYPTETIENYITSEARFIFDNSHNDLLIFSENLIQFLTNKMDSTFSNIESLNLGILWAGIAACVVLVAVTITYIIKINREYHIFANVLFTLSQEDALRTESILVAFHDMLEKDYEAFDCIEALEAAQTNPQVKAIKQDNSNHVKKGIQVNSSKSIQKVSITNLKKENFFLFIKMLLIIACIVGALMFYYFWSLQRIHTMETQQNIINSSLDYIKLQSMISVELQSLAQDNDTSYIRNQPLLTSLNNDMERLAQISELENAFRDTSGQLPALQLEILSGYNCDDVTTDLYLLSPGSAEEECADLAAGTNVIGLVEVITKMQFQMTIFLEQFFSSPRDNDELKVLYLDVINDFIEFLDVSITMFLMSYSFTLVEFQELVDELTSGGHILAAVGVIIACMIGIWGWLAIIRPLTSKEFDRKRVLSMMPAVMLLSNKHIKAYVVRNVSAGAREARYLLK